MFYRNVPNSYVIRWDLITQQSFGNVRWYQIMSDPTEYTYRIWSVLTFHFSSECAGSDGRFWTENTISYRIRQNIPVGSDRFQWYEFHRNLSEPTVRVNRKLAQVIGLRRKGSDRIRSSRMVGFDTRPIGSDHPSITWGAVQCFILILEMI